MKKLILITLLALTSTSSWGEFWIEGVGTVGCGKFVSAKQDGGAGYTALLSWVQGFISATNWVIGTRYSVDSMLGQGVDSDSKALWIENYCRENPLDKLADATTALTLELMEKSN